MWILACTALACTPKTKVSTVSIDGVVGASGQDGGGGGANDDATGNTGDTSATGSTANTGNTSNTGSTGSTGATGMSGPADTTAPSLVSASPAALQINVSHNATILLTFDETIATASPGAWHVTQNSNNITGTVAIEGTSVRFTPDAPLTTGAAVFVTVDEVRDAAGNASDPVDYYFVVTNWTGITQRGAMSPISAALSADGSFVLCGDGNGFDGAPDYNLIDIAVVKYDKVGQRKWTVVLGGSNNEQVSDCTITPAGDVYVVGPTPSNWDGQTLVGGTWDLYLTKIPSDGSPIGHWTRFIGSMGDETNASVAVNGSGDVFVVGDTNGVIGTTGPAGSDDNIFVHRFDANGNARTDLGYPFQFGTATYDYSSDALLDGTTLWVLGTTFGSMAPGTNQGFSDVFVARIDTTTHTVQTSMFGTNQRDYPHTLMQDGAGVMAVGWTEGAFAGASNSSNNHQPFYVDVSASGVVGTVTQLNGVSTYDNAGTMCEHPSGDLILTLASEAKWDSTFDQGATSDTDMVILRRTRAGQTVWARQFGGDTDGLDWAGTALCAANGLIHYVSYSYGTFPSGTSGGYVLFTLDADGNLQ